MAARNGDIPSRTVQRDLVVIGASAGGVDGLQELVAGLPPEFPAAILVVLHVPSSGTSVLPQILSRRGRLPAVFAGDGEQLQRGQIYVAPADHHMLVHGDTIQLSKGPRENGHRPAIDPLFRSAARSGGGRCIGVVMSGMLDDGAAGLRFLKERGGIAVVQDPADAQFPSMPNAARATTDVDALVSAANLADALCGFVAEGFSDGELKPGEPDPVELEDPRETAALLEGPPSALTCPECGGALWEQHEHDVVRFKCHVGHAYSLDSLVEEQGTHLEGTLWSAVRSLEERADVHRRLARRAGTRRRHIYEERAEEAEAHARSLREILSAAGRLTAPEQA